ncbi:XRE family transcriptional regulator [Agrobacterium sp. CNPSo 2736]|uniref:helix-turn-helix domain-containing protein n=1 Tax=Agrobacterium sp. CNPSo 2736 TaxID=2499627 RepID=UPI000FDA857D|nr:helix-turn-helix transcriptional regulator [Agrobacterium sp. CNPSo 2736]RVT80198.1 XRE family transcriptional regulator [Agrobacterium sp. CNPSo 2736]
MAGMMRNMSHDTLDMLREIEAHYRQKGAISPQNEIASALGVNQSTVSKWLSKKLRPDRHTAKIMALYHDVTGNEVGLPVVQTSLSEEIRDVVEVMRKLNLDDRFSVLDHANCLLSRRQASLRRSK